MSAKSPARPGPPSSPRLPSPPPLPELQLGPRSPSINATAGELSLEEAAAQDEGAARRVRPGTSAADMARGPPSVPLHQLESPFQLQEYLKSAYSDLTRGDSSDTVKPITKESAMQLATPPIQQDTGDPVDRNLWLYELCRFLVQRTNRLIVSFFAEVPPCSSQTCPEMRASEWQYLCAVHEPPKSCCAIDYCCHTLDWAANALTSPKDFPSRLSLGGEGGSAYKSMRQLTNIFRRVYRIYAHAWFQHRDTFWSLESEEGLYKFFRTVCDAYSLIPEDNYTIPSEAEAEREDAVDTPISQRLIAAQVLKDEQPEPTALPEPGADTTGPALGPTVRRHGHRHTPSTGTHVTMIAEGPEEEEETTAIQSQTSQIEPENLTTLSEQLAATPPKLSNDSVSRSPRPSMTIPINDTREDLRVPEDPTPTPERHASDPFSDSASIEATQQAMAAVTSEQTPSQTDSTGSQSSQSVSTESGSVSVKNEEKPSHRIPIPPLETQTPPRTAHEDEEVRSPGGGSIRTVGSDILSGILAHVDNDTQAGFTFPEQSNNTVPPTEPEAVTEKQQIDTPDKTDDTTSESTTVDKPDKKDEDLEEMGEIKLVETAVLTNQDAETDTATSDDIDTKEDDTEVETKGKEKEVISEARDDGTRMEETPSGVV